MKKIGWFGLVIVTVAFTTGCKNKTSTARGESKDSEYSTSVDFQRTVMQILDQDPEYNSFLKLVNSASYFDEIQEMNNITVFVPTDEAFGPDKNVINELSTPENLDRLTGILKYHFVKGEFDTENIRATIELQKKPLRLQTVNGGYIAIRVDNEKLKILDESGNLVTIKKAGLKGSNGIVYGIDQILMPRKQTENAPNTSKVAD